MTIFRWFIEQFETAARELYVHTECVTIDETLINYYGEDKCEFLVYIKDKPGKRGILVR